MPSRPRRSRRGAAVYAKRRPPGARASTYGKGYVRAKFGKAVAKI
jgi:hypothetical protein